MDGPGDTTTTTVRVTTAAPTTAATTTTAAGATTTAAASDDRAHHHDRAAGGHHDPAAPPGTGTTPASGALELEGVTWTLSDKTDLGVPLGDVDVTARFLAGQVGGTSGCNQYRGTYVLNGDQLTINPNVASTLIACPAPQSAVEAAYLKVLPTVASYAITDTTLSLSNAAGKVVLVYDHIAGEQILAGDWQVTALRTPTAISSPVPGSTLTMSFKDGQVSGSSGCNTYSGSYTVNGDELTFGPTATTRKACADQAVTDQETAFLAALEATASFSGTTSAVTLLAAGRHDHLQPGSRLIRWRRRSSVSPGRCPRRRTSASTTPPWTSPPASPTAPSPAVAGATTTPVRTSLDDHSLTIGPQLVSTMMACPDPAMAVEAAYLRLLPTVDSFTIDGDTLTLTDATATPVLVFDHIPAESALAGSWSIVAVRTADAVASTLPGIRTDADVRRRTRLGTRRRQPVPR